jgi:hypothetical protein
MATKEVCYDFFFTYFSIKVSVGSHCQLFLKQHLYKALLAQSLPIVEFYHWLKYLHNFQSHPVFNFYRSVAYCGTNRKIEVMYYRLAKKLVQYVTIDTSKTHIFD